MTNSPGNEVTVRVEDLRLPTYLPAAPDRHPMFLERRVYQGSSGRVYPLPFTDRIAEQPVERRWRAVWLENEYLRVLVLPELGGRIHALEDKSRGCDLIYRQPVIKPALVGLAGPWISGGIEFNWPQHHRPATFLPVDFEVETGADGSRTVWCSDHDPMARMKGMHGVCLRPGVAVLEVKVRVHNRTPHTQTFLWWANVATQVHEAYQSFFPPDVRFVADHAKRATSAFPRCQGRYYGVDYARRAREGVPAAELPATYRPLHRGLASPGTRPVEYTPDDLSFYANIPTPCSYMAPGSRQDFFGGYDHRLGVGIVHVANHHLSPGKKQWTWGNHAFGYAWDRNLTDARPDGEYPPYIELMAGVYTDNQPDFSFLQPGETRSWRQYWYPIHRIGPAQHANREAAVSMELGRRRFRVGVAVNRARPGARVRLEQDGASAEWVTDLAPNRPFVLESPQGTVPWRLGSTTLRVLDQEGRECLAYRPTVPAKTPVPAPADEPPPPEAVASADELYVIGLHLEQYRHATRCPTLYWREALRRDPGDARCNTALGRWQLRRGEFELAAASFRAAIARLTRRNPNPADGEPYYQLGLCLRYQADAAVDDATAAVCGEESYAAYYKATWNQAWAGASYVALAEWDGRRGDWARAAEHCQQALAVGGDLPRARNLWALAMRRLGQPESAEAVLRSQRAADPLDWWTRHLLGEPVRADLQTRLDLAHDYARAGALAEAVALLEPALAELERTDGGSPVTGDLPTQSWGAAPLVAYTLGWLRARSGDSRAALADYRRGAALSPDYCFPARLEEIAVFESARRANPRDPRAPYYLGNLLYDRRRHAEALALWEASARLDPGFAIVWRNLGIGYYNVRRQPGRARTAYERAVAANPNDARLLYERDQLWKRLGVGPERRLRELERQARRVAQRDDLSVELCALFNQVGRPESALLVLTTRHFQPWEGGEGLALAQHVRTHLALGRRALRRGDAAAARDYFESASQAPPGLGEARHLLANDSDVRYWLGVAYDHLGDAKKAREQWRAAATFTGDFQEMSVRAFSELTYYSALAWGRLGQPRRQRTLLLQLRAHARELANAPAQIDYFATSLPTMLLFEDDLADRQRVTALFLEAQAEWGLGRRTTSRRLLRRVLEQDPNHGLAADLWGELQETKKRSPSQPRGQ